MGSLDSKLYLALILWVGNWGNFRLEKKGNKLPVGLGKKSAFSARFTIQCEVESKVSENAQW